MQEVLPERELTKVEKLWVLKRAYDLLRMEKEYVMIEAYSVALHEKMAKIVADEA